MTSSILVLPLLINIIIVTYIRKRATENVSGRATWVLIGLGVVFLSIYLPSLLGLTKAQTEFTGAIPDFIEENFLWRSWTLTEVWLTAAIFDFIYTVSGTTLPIMRNLRLLLHVGVGLGFVWLAYSYFAPFVSKLQPLNQTQPTNQTRTT